MINNIICYFWKHRISFNDGGCDVCGRCGKHEFYDNDFHDGKPIFKIINFFQVKYQNLKWWYKVNILKELPF